MQRSTVFYSFSCNRMYSDTSKLYFLYLTLAICQSKINDGSEKFTFESMRLSKVSIEQLRAWSAKSDVIERYRSYLNEPKEELNEDFYLCPVKNCKTADKTPLHPKQTCHTPTSSLPTDHDDHDAQFFKSPQRPSKKSSGGECHRNPSSSCEERPTQPRIFPCGDGQCIDLNSNQKCANGRHLLLEKAENDEKIFAEKCKKTLNCKRRPSDKVDGLECKQWLEENSMAPETFEVCKKKFK